MILNRFNRLKTSLHKYNPIRNQYKSYTTLHMNIFHKSLKSKWRFATFLTVSTPLSFYIWNKLQSQTQEPQTQTLQEPLYIQFEKVDLNKRLNWISTSFRFIYLTLLYTPLLVSLPFLLLLEYYWTESGFRRLWMNWLHFTLERSGPTFIKLGQWASSRADLFPPDICLILSKLQSNVAPHSFEITSHILQQEYGENWKDIFPYIDPNVIGVGAIAQVYKAQLQNSDFVAVKIRHPNVEFKIYADILIMSTIAKWISFIPGTEWLSLPEEVETFGNMLMNQLDLRNEARHLILFESRFKDRSTDGISFPKVYNEYTRERILVEEFINGIPIQEFLTNGPTVFDSRLAKKGLDGFLKMLIIDNFVHADLHPGNILVTFQPNGSVYGSHSILNIPNSVAIPTDPKSQLKSKLTQVSHLEPQLVFLDAGLISSLSEKNLINFLDLFVAITQFDGKKIASLMISRSRNPESVISPLEFESKMDSFLAEIKLKASTLQHIHVGEILATVLNMVRQHHVKIEGEFVNVAVAIMLIEGIGKRLDANVDAIQESAPILKSVMGRGDHVSRVAKQVYTKVKLYSTVMGVRQYLSSAIESLI